MSNCVSCCCMVAVEVEGYAIRFVTPETSYRYSRPSFRWEYTENKEAAKRAVNAGHTVQFVKLYRFPGGLRSRPDYAPSFITDKYA